MSELSLTYATYTISATAKPCVECGKPIQGGQLYTTGPRHLGCPLAPVTYWPKGRL